MLKKKICGAAFGVKSHCLDPSFIIEDKTCTRGKVLMNIFFLLRVLSMVIDWLG